MSPTKRPREMLSEYEEKRIKNIERNNKRLQDLGLLSAIEVMRSNALARGEVKCQERKIRNTQKKMKPARKSRRLQGLDAELADEMKTSSADINPTITTEERIEIMEECRQARLKAAAALAQECGAFDKAARKNPTASYDHALMRVRTMSTKALLNRVKAIERAAGKYCVIKMALFKSALQDEKLWEVADEANEALERLKGLYAPP